MELANKDEAEFAGPRDDSGDAVLAVDVDVSPALRDEITLSMLAVLSSTSASNLNVHRLVLDHGTVPLGAKTHSTVTGNTVVSTVVTSPPSLVIVVLNVEV